MSPNPTRRPTPTGSARTSEPHIRANAGTMKVAVLAAVGVVRRRTRKKMGQATAVDRTPTPSSEIAPSAASGPGVPDRSATGRAMRAPAVSMPVASSVGGTSDSLARTRLPATA